MNVWCTLASELLILILLIASARAGLPLPLGKVVTRPSLNPQGSLPHMLAFMRIGWYNLAAASGLIFRISFPTPSGPGAVV
eukprot:2034994-Pyramimonas_sp.AAC.1